MTVRLKRKYLGNETRYLQVKSMMLTDAGSNESVSMSVWQIVRNINNSISERKFSKIIMTSIYRQSKIIFCRYFISIVN